MTAETLLHASAVACQGRGVLILGPSGSGKSGLALQLIALGATLIADDRTQITLTNGQLIASAPAALAGLIEARGLGILRTPHTTAPLSLALDLATPETDRLPPRRQITILGKTLDLVHGSVQNHFPAAVLCYLQGGRQE